MSKSTEKLYPKIEPEADEAEAKNSSQDQEQQPQIEQTSTGSAIGSWLDGGWASSLVNTAKEKTKNTIEIMKKDIHEISDSIQHGANTLASETAKRAQIIQQMIAPTPDSKEAQPEGENASNKNEDLKTPTSNPPAEIGENNDSKGKGGGGGGLFGMGWMKQVVETVHKFATEDTTKDEEECTEAIRVGPGGRRTILDQCTLLQIQNDPRTFLQPPQQNVDLYKEWMNEFKIVEYNGEINMLLGHNHRLREIYAELVPSQVDNTTFWNRYFFKVHLKELDKQISSGNEVTGGTLKLNMDNKVGGSAGHSPAPSNGKDDWSMCSSGVTTEAEDCENGANEREDASTPRPQKDVVVKNVDEDGDDWDECEDEVATAGKKEITPTKSK